MKRIPATYHEYPVVTKSGEILWLGQNTQLVMDGEKIVGFQSIARDVTQRRQAEEKLRRANEMQQKLLATAATAIFTLDPEGIITGVNEEFPPSHRVRARRGDRKILRYVFYRPSDEACAIRESALEASVFKRQCAVRAKDGRNLRFR